MKRHTQIHQYTRKQNRSILILLLILPFLFSASPHDNKNDSSQENNVYVPVSSDFSRYGIDLEIRDSVMYMREGTSSYVITGVISSNSLNISLLGIRLSLFGTGGSSLISMEREIQGPDMPPVYPGDSVPFRIIERFDTPDSAPRGAFISLDYIDAEPSDSTSDSAEMRIENTDLIDHESISITFGLRRTASAQALRGGYENGLHIEFENTGSAPISELEISVLWKNSENSVIAEERTTLIRNNQALLMPSERRVFSISAFFDQEEMESVAARSVVIEGVSIGELETE
ncbi:MAG: hypothetical protein ACLFR1_05710 [Spirochaetia bacterium]